MGRMWHFLWKRRPHVTHRGELPPGQKGFVAEGVRLRLSGLNIEEQGDSGCWRMYKPVWAGKSDITGTSVWLTWTTVSCPLTPGRRQKRVGGAPRMGIRSKDTWRKLQTLHPMMVHTIWRTRACTNSILCYIPPHWSHAHRMICAVFLVDKCYNKGNNVFVTCY